jgi:anti-sigma factor RsiW
MATESPTSAPMECGDVERSADPYLDGEFDERERAEVDAHLAGCERCRTRWEELAGLRAAVRARLREAMTPPSAAGRAPAALRARIEDALANERRPLWRRLFAPLPLGALGACAAGAMLVLTLRGGDDAMIAEAVRSHHRGLPLEVMSASVGEGMIPSWFTGKLDFHPSPPHFRGDGVHLVGARLSHLRELPAAYIRYELPRGQAGLFIVDDPHGRFAAGGREVRVGPHILRVVNARGYNVAVWRENEIVYSLVSDLDEDALFELVRTAQAGR